ncbi:Transposase and inactivated derivatives, TnpA family [Rhizobiales bacterium GAS191]|nr:Transposase and inactivated derivatives, TnpA family [Rhizobiales bacterium GAS191]
MAQRSLLKADRWIALLGAPTAEDTLIRHYTLTRAELDHVRGKTAPHNQLGLAIQFCLMRHLGRSWRHEEALPAVMVEFIAEQIDVEPAVLAEYGRREQSRREHALEAQGYLGLRPADRHDLRAALTAAVAAADASDQGQPIAEAMIAALRERQALLPAVDTLDRIGRAARAMARRRMQAALLNGLGPEQVGMLDSLLFVDPAIGMTRFAWLRTLPEAPSEKSLMALIERLRFVRDLSFDPRSRDRIHPDRWMQLVREGNVTPSWLAGDFNEGRRRTTIAAQLIELTGRLTDAAITMFCRLIARLFMRSRARRDRRHLDARADTARLMGLFRDTLRALAEASETGEDTFDVLDRRIGWHHLMRARAEVEAIAGSTDPDPLLGAAERSDGVRRSAHALLEAFVFRSARRHDPLLTALCLLRQLVQNGRRSLPDKVPVGHLKDRVRKVVLAGGGADRRLYEVATFAVLRDRLRSGDVWVEGGRSYQPLDAHLMPSPAFRARKAADDLDLGIPRNVDAWLAEKQRELDFKLKQLAYRARVGKLPGVRLVDGVLIVSPPRANVPKAAEAVKWLCLDRMPLIEITDLIADVDAWTGFAGCFSHLRTGEPVRSLPALYAGILADATNLGPKRMAEASEGVSARQIAWARLFHLRHETFKAGVARVIDAQLVHPYARIWGAGSTSSSDGQFFRAAGRGARRADVNAHYGGDPSSKFYTWISDQHGHFYILPMGATESEAAYVLDGLYGHESRLEIEEHYVDTGGANDHVFGSFAVLGKRFAPRLRDLKDWRLHAFEDVGAYPLLKRHIGDRVDAAAIREAWDEILRIGLSIETRAVAPSTVLKKLAALPRTNVLSRALREIGRIERTLFMIEWYSDPALRSRCRAGLNKGEAGNKLTRAVFFHERGEIRDGSFESQAFRASALNLVVSAIILWNTVYLSRVVDHLRADGHDLPEELLRHVSPQIWEHINLIGTYDWSGKSKLPTGTFRSLRVPRPAFLAA